MKALVSILIPAYNADEWVVDHGPTDGTLAVARQFESNEVRVVTQPNQGAVAARVPSAGDTANPDELPRGCGAWGGAVSPRRITPPTLPGVRIFSRSSFT